MSITHADFVARFTAGISKGADTDSPSRILPNLYLGSLQQAKNVPLIGVFGINAVLNVCHDCDTGAAHYGPSFSFLHVKMEDDDDFPIGSHLDACVAFITAAHKDGRTVLVHCQAGVSRSASVVLAHLMVSKRCSLREVRAFYSGHL